MKTLLKTSLAACMVATFVFVGAVPSAQAASRTWIGIGDSTGYRASSLTAREPVIYAQSLDSLRKERIGVASGSVSPDESAANARSVALTVIGTKETSLVIFKRGSRSIKVDAVTDSECQDPIQAPVESAVVPLDLRSDGTLTYLKRGAETDCYYRLLRRDPRGHKHQVWMPPSAASMDFYSNVEVKGKLVLLGNGRGGWPPSIVYNSESQRLVYTLPERLAGYPDIHLATSGTLGLSVWRPGNSSAVRVNLKTHREVRFEFPKGANARFCGRFTVFAGGHLVKVYDEIGRTLLRQPTRDFSAYPYPAFCSAKYAALVGMQDRKSAAQLLSLTSFKLREVS